LEDYAEEIIALVEEQRDRTLDEIVAAMHERLGSRAALFRFLQRHGITFKKVLHASEPERTDVARARRRWIREQGLLDSSGLVFIDETSVNTNIRAFVAAVEEGSG